MPSTPQSARNELGTVVRSKSLTDQAYAQLRRALLFGALKPGDKVTGRQVSQTLGVSLTPAREAIIRLAKEGALEAMPNRAFAVPVLSRSRYQEILKIRLQLEGMAAAEAATHADAEAVEDLVAINERMAEMVRRREYAKGLHYNLNFHFGVYTLSAMPVLVSIINSLWLQTGPTRSLLTPKFQQTLEGYENHKPVIEALRRGDGPAAREALINDLSVGANYVLSVLED